MEPNSWDIEIDAEYGTACSLHFGDILNGKSQLVKVDQEGIDFAIFVGTGSLVDLKVIWQKKIGWQELFETVGQLSFGDDKKGL